jgi:hypothetical protein
LEKDTHAFVIRVWNEGNSAGKTKIWRGYIEHVNHDSRMYFSDINGVARFIQKQIGFQSEETTSGWHAWLSWITHAVSETSRKIHF